MSDLAPPYDIIGLVGGAKGEMRCNGGLTAAAKNDVGREPVGMSDLVTDLNHKTCEVTEPNIPTANAVLTDGEFLTPPTAKPLQNVTG